MAKAISDSGKKPAEIARDMGVDQSKINNWLNGKHEPGAYYIAEFSKSTECDTFWLLTGSPAHLTPENKNSILSVAVENESEKRLLEACIRAIGKKPEKNSSFFVEFPLHSPGSDNKISDIEEERMLREAMAMILRQELEIQRLKQEIKALKRAK